ncbi:hypothetical protein [Nonomuraea sp. B19D2]|uniref:hypothetical protein n=1 Tax=Nonomuraea sp. B19D2 TaxID=3159561 RepID=UPI0032DA8524
MKLRTKRLLAAVLAVAAAGIGVWAQFAPHSFYTSFPLPGRHWVSALGPYNEHMTRDTGGLFLSMLLVSTWATVRPRAETMRLAGAAWLAFSIPHFVFHMLHLDIYETVDKIANIIALGGMVVLAALLLLPTRPTTSVSVNGEGKT